MKTFSLDLRARKVNCDEKRALHAGFASNFFRENMYTDRASHRSSCEREHVGHGKDGVQRMPRNETAPPCRLPVPLCRNWKNFFLLLGSMISRCLPSRSKASPWWIQVLSRDGRIPEVDVDDADVDMDRQQFGRGQAAPSLSLLLLEAKARDP